MRNLILTSILPLSMALGAVSANAAAFRYDCKSGDESLSVEVIYQRYQMNNDQTHFGTRSFKNSTGSWKENRYCFHSFERAGWRIREASYCTDQAMNNGALTGSAKVDETVYRCKRTYPVQISE